VFSTIKHYLPHLSNHFSDIADFRQQSKVKYPAGLMLWIAVIQRLSGIKSNNELEITMKTSTQIEKNIALFSGAPCEELPSLDCSNYFFQNLPPEELCKIRRKTFAMLERKKILEKLKTTDGYVMLAIDGVQTFSTTRKIEHSTFRKHENGTTTYHQYYLEAKVVGLNGIVISLDSEPIENPTGEFKKQDCEPEAAKRLLERVAKQHPHLKFWIMGDALYCNSVIMDICRKHNWIFSFTFKGKSQNPKLFGEINSELNVEQRKNRLRIPLKKNKTTELFAEFRWCSLKYEFGKRGEREIYYLEAKIIKIKNGIETEVTTFAYLTNEYINKNNVMKKFMICRSRWKIENEGFNFQKNNMLRIRHSFTSIGHGGQNYYLIAQIVHTIIQLAYFSDMAGRVRRATTGDLDNLSQTLKNVFRSFLAVAYRIKVEVFERELRPPLLGSMRIRLKFA